MKKKPWIGIGLILTVAPLSILLGEGGDFAPAEKWVARYNGPGNGDDCARAMAVDASGHIYVSGESFGTGTGYDFATVKYNPQGKRLWAKRYDGLAHGDDLAKRIAVDGSGNVFVFGESKGLGTGFDLATVKYSANGKRLWVQRYNGKANGDEAAGGLAVDGSGNVYIAGSISEESVGCYFATIKYDPQGRRLWTRYHSDPNNDNLHYYGGVKAVAVDGSGNPHVAGWVVVGGVYDMATVKYDANGNRLWARTYNGPSSGSDYATAIVLDGSGRVSVTGQSDAGDFHLDRDWVTVGYDAGGKVLWTRRYAGPAKDIDEPTAIAMDRKGQTYVTGWATDSKSHQDCMTIKYGAAGKQLWARRYDGSNDHDRAFGLVLDEAGHVYVAGDSRNEKGNYDYVTLAYDLKGNRLWIRTYDGPGQGEDSAMAIILDKSGGLYVSGGSEGAGTKSDFATIKY